MTVVETLLTFVVAPAVILGGIYVWAGAGKRSRRARYKAGDTWPYAPLFWTANPAGADLPAAHGAHAAGTPAITAGGAVQETRGGTSGKW